MKNDLNTFYLFFVDNFFRNIDILYFFNLIILLSKTSSSSGIAICGALLAELGILIYTSSMRAYNKISHYMPGKDKIFLVMNQIEKSAGV